MVLVAVAVVAVVVVVTFVSFIGDVTVRFQSCACVIVQKTNSFS